MLKKKLKAIFSKIWAFIKKVYNIGDYFGKEFSRYRIPTYAANCAFFMFLSLVPLIVLVCSLLQYTSLTQDTLMRFLGDLLPETIEGFITGIINEVYSASIGTLSLSILVTLWSSSRAFIAITKGLNEIYSVKQGRNYFVQRFYAMLYTLGLLFSIILSLGIMVFGDTIVSLLNLSGVIYDVILWLRYIIIFLFLALVFANLYKFAPNKKLRFRDQIPGALIAALAWILFSFFFSIYISHSGGMSAYGSLAAIVIAMLWMFYCMYIVLIGGYINRLIADHRRQDTAANHE